MHHWYMHTLYARWRYISRLRYIHRNTLGAHTLLTITLFQIYSLSAVIIIYTLRLRSAAVGICVHSVLVKSDTDVRARMHSVFQFILKVFSAVKLRVLCRSIYKSLGNDGVFMDVTDFACLIAVKGNNIVKKMWYLSLWQQVMVRGPHPLSI